MSEALKKQTFERYFEIWRGDAAMPAEEAEAVRAAFYQFWMAGKQRGAHEMFEAFSALTHTPKHESIQCVRLLSDALMRVPAIVTDKT
jgi:hypothetical protein